MSPMTIIIFALFGVLLFVCFFALVFGFQLLKQKNINLRLKEVNDNLSGHYVDHGPWKHPLIVIDHEGLRTRISFQRTMVGDSTGTSMLQVKELKLTTDGHDPQFRMCAVPHTLTSKASPFVRRNPAPTGTEVFDDRFVVASNRYEDSMGELISPDVARKLLPLSSFEPLNILAGNGGKKKTKDDAPVSNTVLERKRKKLPLWNINLQSAAKQINKHRFKLSFDEGKSELKLLIHESENDSLEDHIYTLVDVQREITANLLTLQKQIMEKSGVKT